MVYTRKNKPDEFFSLSNKEKLKNLIVTTNVDPSPQHETTGNGQALITFEKLAGKTTPTPPPTESDRSAQQSQHKKSTASATETFHTESLGISFDSSSIKDVTLIDTHKDSRTASSKIPTPKPPTPSVHPENTDPPLPAPEENDATNTNDIIEEVNKSIATVHEVADNVEKLALQTHQTLTGNTSATFSELKQVIEGLAGIRLESTVETPKSASREKEQNNLQRRLDDKKYTGTRKKRINPEPQDWNLEGSDSESEGARGGSREFNLKTPHKTHVRFNDETEFFTTALTVAQNKPPAAKFAVTSTPFAEGVGVNNQHQPVSHPFGFLRNDLPGTYVPQTEASTSDNNYSREINSAKTSAHSNNQHNNTSIPGERSATVPRDRMENMVRLRDALEAVPKFSGTSSHASYREFSAGCTDAKNMLPAWAEENLVKMICTKLMDGAKSLVRGENFRTVEALLNQLQEHFRPPTVSELIRELSRIHQGYDEDVASYASRVREMRSDIIETHRRAHNGICSDERKREYDTEVIRSFIIGLRFEVSAQVKPGINLETTIREALDIEKILKDQAALRLNQAPSGNTMAPSSSACQICHRSGHATDNCRLKPRRVNVAQKEELCQIGSEPGHSAKECNNNITCKYCKTPGHEINQCPQIENAALKCQLCGKHGHLAKDCMGKGRPSQKCQICNKPGHEAKNCKPLEKCQLCQKPGHTARQCGQQNGKGSGKMCYACQQPGHFARECPQRSKPVPTCQICLAHGHTALDCRARSNIPPERSIESGNLMALPPMPTQEGVHMRPVRTVIQNQEN